MNILKKEIEEVRQARAAKEKEITQEKIEKMIVDHFKTIEEDIRKDLGLQTIKKYL